MAAWTSTPTPLTRPSRHAMRASTDASSSASRPPASTAGRSAACARRQRKNCRFFETHAQAEAAAFRPCMKCRPEIAPGAGHAWTVMDASRTLARQAGDVLDAQAPSGEMPSLAALAARLGVSEPPPAPHLPRRARRDAAAVRADAAPAARQAVAHRFDPAGCAGRARERLPEPAALQTPPSPTAIG